MVDSNIGHHEQLFPAPDHHPKYFSDPFKEQCTCGGGNPYDRIAVAGPDASAGSVTDIITEGTQQPNADCNSAYKYANIVCTSNHLALEAQVTIGKAGPTV